MQTKFTPIEHPYIYGVEAERDDGITVEVVRCEEASWNVFLTALDEYGFPRIVARSVEEYRACGNGYVPRTQAMAIARKLL